MKRITGLILFLLLLSVPWESRKIYTQGLSDGDVLVSFEIARDPIRIAYPRNVTFGIAFDGEHICVLAGVIEGEEFEKEIYSFEIRRSHYFFYRHPICKQLVDLEEFFKIGLHLYNPPTFTVKLLQKQAHLPVELRKTGIELQDVIIDGDVPIQHGLQAGRSRFFKYNYLMPLHLLKDVWQCLNVVG